MENTETECRAVLTRLYVYLDGEAAEADCAEIGRHLDRCVQCARRFGFERELKELVHRKCGGVTQRTGISDLIRTRLREVTG